MKHKLTLSDRSAFLVNGLIVLALISFLLPAVFLVTLAKYYEELDGGSG